jgi:hypothetical protein
MNTFISVEEWPLQDEKNKSLESAPVPPKSLGTNSDYFSGETGLPGMDTNSDCFSGEPAPPERNANRGFFFGAQSLISSTYYGIRNKMVASYRSLMDIVVNLDG